MGVIDTRLRQHVALLSLALAPSLLPAQAMPATAADSAAAARTAYRTALAQYGRGQLDSAMHSVASAHAWWPSQAAYLSTLALVAARRSDVIALTRSLDALARMESGEGVARDSAVVRMSSDPAVAAAIARLDAALAPAPRGTPFATFADSTIFPEGLDVDAGTGTVYLASIRHGAIIERRADGRERSLPIGYTGRIGAVLAVRVDVTRGVLWATTSGIPQADGYAAADSALASLLEVRIRDGHVLRTVSVPVAAGGRVLGDVALMPNGDVLFSDSQHGELFRLRRGADTVETIRHPLFRSLQGIAPTLDGTGAYVADYSHGVLHVNLATSVVTRVAESNGSSSLGLDGIALHRGRIIGVQNGMAPMRIVALTLDASGKRIVRTATLDRQPRIADEPTIGVVSGDDYYYVANSQWEKYDARGARAPGTVLTRPVVLRLSLASTESATGARRTSRK